MIAIPLYKESIRFDLPLSDKHAMMKSPKNETSSSHNLSDTPCDRCKLHHRKCSRNLAQCSNCEKRGIRCTYLTTPKRRGPKTKVDSMLEYCESMSSLLFSKPTTTMENKPIITNSDTNSSSPVQSQPLTEYLVNPMLYPNVANYSVIPTTVADHQQLSPYYFNYKTSWFPSIMYDPFDMGNRLLYIDSSLPNQPINNNSDNSNNNNNDNNDNNNNNNINSNNSSNDNN